MVLTEKLEADLLQASDVVKTQAEKDIWECLTELHEGIYCDGQGVEAVWNGKDFEHVALRLLDAAQRLKVADGDVMKTIAPSTVQEEEEERQERERGLKASLKFVIEGMAPGFTVEFKD